MINITVSELFPDVHLDDQIEKAVISALTFLNIDKAENDLSVVIEGNEFLQDLNLKYRQINSPTDVLSFPSGDIDPENNHIYLGDIIISYPEAKKQAVEASHSIIDEIQLLVVHGLLHLLGYDHASDEEKEIMWDAQTKIMNNLKSDTETDC